MQDLLRAETVRVHLPAAGFDQEQRGRLADEVARGRGVVSVARFARATRLGRRASRKLLEGWRANGWVARAGWRGYRLIPLELREPVPERLSRWHVLWVLLDILWPYW